MIGKYFLNNVLIGIKAMRMMNEYNIDLYPCPPTNQIILV